MIRLFIFCLSLFYLGTQAQAQNNLGGWVMYFGDATIKNSSLKLNYEVQHRNYSIYSDLNQLLLRGNLQYTGIKGMPVAVGYASVITEKKGKPNNPFYENRIFQELATSQLLGKISVRHRFRFEQRFFNNQDFRTRLRYQLELTVPIYQGEKGNSFYANAYNEIFINTNKTNAVQNVFDRNRISVGLGYRFTKSFAIQTAYMVQLFEKGNERQLTLGFYQSI